MKILKRLSAASLLAATLHAGNAWGFCSPIVIDLGNNGIKLGEAGTGVHFDVNANGTREHIQWVRPGGDEAFLVLDRSGNGLIDDGSELFGVGTPLILDGRNAPNGFVGLAQYDLPQLGGNDDGQITEADAIWPQLRLWTDLDANGISTRAEISSLRQAGITSLDTIPRVRKYLDEAGNIIPYWAWAKRARNTRAIMVDVFFKQLP